MSNAYWEVAVAAALPQTLTYKAPQSMAHILAPGLRVLVPLGRRLVTGYLLEKAQPPQGFSARDIQGVLDSAPLFPESLIAFFRWIADYYFYPLGQVIKEALPSGINNPEEVQCAITDEGRNNLLAGKVRTLAQRAVLKELAESGPALQKELCKKLGPAGSKNSLAALEKNGWISRDPIALPGRVRPHIETFVIPQKESSPAPARMKGRHKILALLK
ncbi:MAG: primosomal protein N', partial [Desulfatibacillaceae bacterium]|nr:primosomal protein N' [Desulfatibacillaceae bacterium]